MAIFHRGSNPAPEGVEAILGDRNELSASADQLRRFAADVVVDSVLSAVRQVAELLGNL